MVGLDVIRIFFLVEETGVTGGNRFSLGGKKREVIAQMRPTTQVWTFVQLTVR